MENIINFENGILISKAENKLLFVTFCFEFRKYIHALNKGQEYFISNLPLQFDASCNGIQHLAALTREVDTAIHTNLIKDPKGNKDLPKDYYEKAANLIQKVLDNSSNESIKMIKLDRNF